MATHRPKNRYRTTQAELYAICTIGWQSYLENQPDFEAFKTLYTTVFGTDALVAVETAKNLPDFQARNQETESAYILMGQTATQCLSRWRALRSYIRSGFPSELQKPNIEAAGEDHYNRALNRNWGETELMLASALSFIADNTSELTAGGMPTDFPTEFADLRTAFLGHYATFTDSGQDEHEGTDEKVLANNAIYDDLMRMFEDGQIIYENNAAKRDRFIFARVKEIITSGPAAGMDPVSPDTIEMLGIVTDSSTALPVQGATLTVLDPPGPDAVTAVTDLSGEFAVKVSGYPENTAQTVNFEISAPGYTTEPVSLELTSGQRYSFEIPLTPMPAPPPAP